MGIRVAIKVEMENGEVFEREISSQESFLCDVRRAFNHGSIDPIDAIIFLADCGSRLMDRKSLPVMNRFEE